MKATWLVPDDYGGGVVSVAQACCREAGHHGFEATLLLLLPPAGHASEFGGVNVQSLDATPSEPSSPLRFVKWLSDHHQDFVLLNGCEQVDETPPFIPAGTRVIYVVHDTAARYFEAAVRNEASLDAIVAVSETVASRFRGRLSDPKKLTVIHNGSVFPEKGDSSTPVHRTHDVIFLGGDKFAKGATDVVALWPELTKLNYSGTLHWFGAVDESLRRQVANLPSNERIQLHGRVPRAEIFATASRSSVCLMLSRVEPFGMATIECMGMGCRVVAWDIETGTNEIASVVGGSLFATLGDYAGLARKVMASIEVSEHERRALADRVRAEFSQAAMWSRYEALLVKLQDEAAVERPHAGELPLPYRPPRRFFQKLPVGLRTWLRRSLLRSPWVGHALRDMRGK